MDFDIQDVIVPLVAFLIPAIGLLIREIHYRRKAKRLAADDSSKVLKERKILLEEMISKTEDSQSKHVLVAQLDEVNAALLGLYSERLQHTLKEAGLPTEERLIADGRSRLQPKQVTHLQAIISGVRALPLFHSAEVLVVLGNAYYHIEQYEDAKDVYDEILNMNHNDPIALNNRGLVYDKLEKYDEALADFNRSLELMPDDPLTLTSRGTTYYKLERYEEAITDFNRSLELRPNDPLALTNRGATYYALKRYEKALVDYDRSLELRPNLPLALTGRGHTHYALKRYHDALADYNDSLELEPDSPDTLSGRGYTNYKLEKYHDALDDFTHSLELKPDDPMTLYNLACLSSIQEKTNDVLAYLEKAIERDERVRESAKKDKDFDNIRDDPRFKKLIEWD